MRGQQLSCSECTRTPNRHEGTGRPAPTWNGVSSLMGSMSSVLTLCSGAAYLGRGQSRGREGRQGRSVSGLAGDTIRLAAADLTALCVGNFDDT